MTDTTMMINTVELDSVGGFFVVIGEVEDSEMQNSSIWPSYFFLIFEMTTRLVNYGQC